MEMVRFLVEEISCDVDFQGYVRVHFPDLPTGFGICKHETPTHGLVRGRTTWWHVSQALPYLAEKRGSNLELRDCFGSTPLDVAISHIGRVTFNRGAVDKLLSLGADAKAVDLSRTCESAEMTDLLLSSGAVVKPAAILAAVRTRNLDVLSMLLSRGGDVNARETATPATPHHQNALVYVESTAPPREKWAPISEVPKHLRGDPRLRQPAPKPRTGVKDTPFSVRAPPYVPEHEMYPLDYAAHLFSRQPELDGYPDTVQQSLGLGPVVRDPPRPLPEGELASVIEMLTAHGADVMATYELADGSRMSIKDRIVLRGRSFIGIRGLDRPRLARKILELCKTSYDGDF
ncbi:putative ankyrin repeat protein [Diaporthe ampelina]|uniref:Putative ankyrin repeat protein n=1 Tax=Diaporthe ampelina TaxID=1214573 RepID=A0A0G2HMA7_9PEZI|nr:putative ankyrin repeat protein [Diaporthe ampelina]